MYVCMYIYIYIYTYIMHLYRSSTSGRRPREPDKLGRMVFIYGCCRPFFFYFLMFFFFTVFLSHYSFFRYFIFPFLPLFFYYGFSRYSFFPFFFPQHVRKYWTSAWPSKNMLQVEIKHLREEAGVCVCVDI